VNKSQLIEALSHQFEGNKTKARDALESVVETITREVTRGEKVAITGFGAFEKVIRPARMVRNPRTGERTRAKKTAVPKFRAGAELKAYVSGAKKLPKVATTAAKKSATSTPARTTTSASAPERPVRPRSRRPRARRRLRRRARRRRQRRVRPRRARRRQRRRRQRRRRPPRGRPRRAEVSGRPKLVQAGEHVRRPCTETSAVRVRKVHCRVDVSAQPVQAGDVQLYHAEPAMLGS
jgi:DNA-binding protein HU-beta